MAVHEMSGLDVLDHSYSSSSRTDQRDWGWLPQLTLVNAIGLFVLSLADVGGRTSAPWADLLFWIGLLVMFAPVAIRILSGTATRHESLALLLVLTTALYLERILQYPLGFAYNDEFQSMRTALDITTSGHLFQINPILPVGSAYPGLQIFTNALSTLSHLPLFPVAGITICVIHLMLTLALFLVYEKISGSSHLAAIATLLYLGDPDYLITGGQFAYSSVGIPLALFVLYAIINCVLPAASLSRRRKRMLLIAALGIGAITVTHHITSYFLAAFLLLWFTLTLHSREPHNSTPLNRVVLGGIAFLSAAMAASWLVLVGGNTVTSYLLSPVLETVQQLILVLLRSSSVRPLFESVYPLQEVPLWERLVGVTSAALILMGQALGFYQVLKQHRTDALSLSLVAASLLYPLSLIVRFTSAGAPIASRITEYAFFPLAFVLALGVMSAASALEDVMSAVRALGATPAMTALCAMPAANWLRRVALGRVRFLRQAADIRIAMSGVASLIFLGGVVVAAGQTWWHTPGPYIASADPRSISAEGIDAALWASSNLAPPERVTGDLINRLLMASYGGQWVVPDPTGTGDAPLDSVFFSSRIGPAQASTLRQMRIHYLVIDLRFSAGLPASGVYFDGDEPNAYHHATPVDPQLLTKFDGMDGVSRLFDNGDIVIYDTGVFDEKP